MSDDAPKQKRPPQLNRKPKSKQIVIEERIEQVIKAISENPKIAHCRLYAYFAKQWGCHTRSVERIHQKAKAELHIRLNRSRETFRCEALAFYEAKRNDPKATVAQQIQAQIRIDELLGLAAPARIFGQHVVFDGPDQQPTTLKTATGAAQIDLTKLSPEMLDQYEAIVNAALALPAPTEPPKGTSHEQEIKTIKSA